MTDDNQRLLAGTVFEREQRREKEINEALKIEAARHAAAVENMHRLRALRLSRDQSTKGEGRRSVEAARRRD